MWQVKRIVRRLLRAWRRDTSIRVETKYYVSSRINEFLMSLPRFMNYQGSLRGVIRASATLKRVTALFVSQWKAYMEDKMKNTDASDLWAALEHLV